MVEDKHVIACPSCGGLNRTLQAYNGLIKCSHCNHMFPHEADSQSISPSVIDVGINLMMPRQKIVKGLQLLVGFYSLVLMLLICYTIFEYASLSEHFGEKSSGSNVDDDSKIIDFDEIGVLIIGICCFLPVAWHWYAFSLILEGTNQLFFD